MESPLKEEAFEVAYKVKREMDDNNNRTAYSKIESKFQNDHKLQQNKHFVVAKCQRSALGGNTGAVSGKPTTTIWLNSTISRTERGYKRNGKSNNERPSTSQTYLKF